MPRVNIYFTEQVLKELKDYVEKKHGSHRAMSITVQQAVNEFLERNDGSSNRIQKLANNNQEPN